MAKDINKYARQNVAQARYARRPSTTPQRRATIDPTLFSGKKAAAGAPLASRPIEGGPALPSPQEYNPIIDAESGEDPNAPRVETQQPITQRGVDPRFMIQGGGPRLDFSGLVPERANPNYDPNKAIGGENVPYKPSGFFRSFLGDPSNRMNIEAQQTQGAEWRAEAKAAKERADRKQDLEDEIALREKGPQRRFDIEQKRLADKEIQDEIERQNAIDLALLKEGNEDVLRDADMVRREAADAAKLALEERRVAAAEASVKKPRYQSIGDGLFQTPEGDLAVFQPEVMRISDAMPGRPAGFRMLTGEGSKPPARSIGDVEVDRLTSKPIVKPPPPAPETENTAIVPSMGRALGRTASEAVTTVADPLRAAGTEIYKQLFSSQAQQDPEVLARMKRREEQSRTANPPRFQNIPMGF
jgi:hypothetical protein